MARIAAEGGVVLADGVSPASSRPSPPALRSPQPRRPSATVFEDFERQDLRRLDDHRRRLRQRPVPRHRARPAAGERVRRATGWSTRSSTATARRARPPPKPFRIERRYIGFLIGGGNHPDKTCINLRVGGKVVRTATGKNREALEPASWDVADSRARSGDRDRRSQLRTDGGTSTSTRSSSPTSRRSRS